MEITIVKSNRLVTIIHILSIGTYWLLLNNIVFISLLI